jgi:arylsulfatase
MKKLFNNRKFNFLTSALVLGGSVSAQYSPTPAFQGKIGKTLADSKESRPETQPHAQPGAPNVVWILIDDIGYGAASAFGGLIETPNIDKQRIALHQFPYLCF